VAVVVAVKTPADRYVAMAIGAGKSSRRPILSTLTATTSRSTRLQELSAGHAKGREGSWESSWVGQNG
jgi:hypothetical protein